MYFFFFFLRNSKLSLGLKIDSYTILPKLLIQCILNGANIHRYPQLLNTQYCQILKNKNICQYWIDLLLGLHLFQCCRFVSREIEETCWYLVLPCPTAIQMWFQTLAEFNCLQPLSQLALENVFQIRLLNDVITF